ncbi:DUF6351 family protein [Prosthecomicrobium sp. N25]|uniref:DUF6351 family protein n=1 Tax=Prosthecomicrobium sp. N25 TaxID=3129254 RepID=UPI003077710E
MRSRGITLAASLAVLTAAVTGMAAAQTKGLKVEVVSSRPELVTGGDALVRISGDAAAPKVSVNGRDVSSAFRADAKGGGFVGVVGDLKDGANQLTATSAAGEASLTLTNYPVNGALFAGPQQQPFVCENETFGLEPAKDESCAAPAKVEYFLRTKGGEWKPYDPKSPKPNDVGTTKTTDGREVPLIVRQERGVINRSAYLINILHDPSAGPLPAPGAPSEASGWNGKLVYSFGGGVQANYHMGRGLGMMTGTDNKYFIEDLGGGLFDYFVTRGYAVAAGSLNVMGTNNDDVKSAETMSKVKEHFIEEFGPPLFTIGHGASGGSMQQHLIANNYPGLLDGIMPARNYPDTMSFLQPLYDCELIANAIKNSQHKFSRDQMGALAGKYWGYCVSNGTRYPNARIDNCDATVKDLIASDPKVKAMNVRCTYQDNLVNIFGRDSKTGFARNPFDNVGVQYGLVPFNEGKISFEQFADINQRIGGLDINGKIMADRMTGDTEALRRAYETGRVTGTGALATVPMVDIRSYVDGDPLGLGDPGVDVHDGYHSAVMRARLEKYQASAANHVMLTTASLGRVQLDTRTGGSPLIRVSGEGLAAIDTWLTAVVNDKSDEPLARKVAKHRPAGLVDACYPTKQGALVGEIEKITDRKTCDTLFRFAGDARLAAGAPATDDVFKCALKPVDPKDYKVSLSAEQLDQLRKIFPDGVCDYTKPGVGQVKTGGTWAFFSADGQYRFLDKVQ